MQYFRRGILIILVIVIIWAISIYNSLVKLKITRQNAFADVDVQLKLRFDLVENLVNTVKGYASHEKETLERVIKARNSFQSAKSVDEKIQADNMLTGALKSIFALSESYPDLKANTNFTELQRELSDIENKIAAARRFFNSATREYNTVIQQFPDTIIAKMFSFKPEEFFEITDENEKKAPKVDFSEKKEK